MTRRRNAWSGPTRNARWRRPVLAFVLGLTVAAANTAAAERSALRFQEEASPVAAEPIPDWFVDVSVGIEAAPGPSLGPLAFDHRLFGSEPGEIDGRYRRSRSAIFEASLGYRVQDHLLIAVAVSNTSHDMDVDVAAQLPHPFFFNRLRAVEGTGAVGREQLALHVSLMWRIREGGKTELALFAGPSWFDFEQEIAVGAEFDSEYPHDTATFTKPEVRLHSSVTTGYHIGAEGVYWFRPSMGLSGTVRLSSGPDELKFDEETWLKVDAGGLQTSVGLRIRF